MTGSSTYETCVSTSDCSDAFDSCVSVNNPSAGTSDSMCTSTCNFDSDCPGSGACVSFDGVNSFCYQTCVTDAICEPGWSCTPVTDGASSFDICLPGSSTPLAPTYSPCAVDDDCADPADACRDIEFAGVSGRECTRSCSSDASCPNGGVCESGICLEPCVGNAMCDAGWGCTTVSGGGGACLPGSGDPPGIPPYNGCPFGANPDQCSELTQGCFQFEVDGVAAGVCTSECDSVADCPITPSGRPGTCVQYSGSPRVCFETCVNDDECLVGFSCKPIVAGEAQRICLPTG
ncbi:hypothetical protein [Sandaracinus amylolyticus]|uniref:hypothetical protein n=1 Tax=Sandaracinus amylolyticus TaxID=927083 RepID=UPI001F452783|nr:hypothetical protein [Sandaracinus amylolyticus]